MGSTVFELQIWHHMGAYGDEEFLSDFARIIHKMKFIWMTTTFFEGKLWRFLRKARKYRAALFCFFAQ